MKQIFTLAFVKKLYMRLKEKEIVHIPEALAFNFIMAIIPLLVVFFQLLAYFSIETNLIHGLISTYIPHELHEFLYDFLANTNARPDGRPLLITTTLITSLWIISKGFYGIFRTFNKERPISSFRNRLLSFGAIFITFLVGVASALFITFSHWLLQDFPIAILRTIDSLIFIASCTAFFTILFWLIPNQKQKLKNIIPGVIVTTICFIIISAGFAFYINKLANYHQIYGSLAVIIILLIWLYLLSFMINLGIQVNYLLKNSNG